MNRKPKKEVLVFLVILGLAIFFRFYQLGTLPPGLWPDEAANGVDALKALDSGEFKIFYPDNNGREGLFINIQAAAIYLFGAEPWVLRMVSAVFGILTVIGLYFLTRYLFDWRTAAVASFFLAISSWHVIFSRIGFRAIMLPFILVWGFYFLWRGIRSGSLKEFFFAGLIGGTGFYTYFSYRIAPLIGLAVFYNHWSFIKKAFDHVKYEYAKTQLLRGFALAMLIMIITAIPLGIYFYAHSGDFLKRDGRPISVLAQKEPLKELTLSTIKTLGMFNFVGDYNQRHNIPGWPELSLPIGILFLAGFFREFIHLFKKKRDPSGKTSRFSTIHVFLFSWFFIMLLPGFLSTEAPHALRVIGVIPVVMIFAARGFWWTENKIMRYHRITDPHTFAEPEIHAREARLFAGITIIIFMLSLTILEYHRYFRVWAKNPGLPDAFTQKYEAISNYLLAANPRAAKYVLINEGDVLVDGVPNNAQTIRFLTKTHNQTCSEQKNIFYLRTDQLETLYSQNNYLLIPLSDSPELNSELFRKFGLRSEKDKGITIYEK